MTTVKMTLLMGTDAPYHVGYMAQSLPSYQCDVIKGAKIDYITEAAATADIIGGALAGGPGMALEEALRVIAEEMQRQYEAFAANAGPVSTSLCSTPSSSKWHTLASQCLVSPFV